VAGSRKLVVEILGDAKGLGKSLDDSGAKLGAWGKKVDAVGTATSATAGKIGKSFSYSADKLGDFGKTVGKVGGAGVLAVGTLAAGAGVALYKLGASFDDAYDKIRVGTGATGLVLDTLKDDFKNVVSSVPTDFGKASDALGQLFQRTGTAGPELQKLAGQMLELSRITETDLTTNIKSSQDAFNAWGVTVKNQPGLLDEMFRASQATGVSVADIGAQIAEAQPQLKSMGFSFERSAALAATLGAAGSSLSDVMPAMGKAMAVAAKQGKSAAKVFGDTFEAIKKAPTATAAAGVALTVFGAKAGPKLAEMIRSGKLSYEDLLKTMQNGGETIIGAGKETQDFSEKWTLLKNRVLVGLEPLAMKVFDAVGKAMDRVGPYVQKLSDGLAILLPAAFAIIGPKVESFFGYLRDTVPPILESVFGWMKENVPKAFEKVQTAVENVAEWLGPKLQDLFQWLKDHVPGYLDDVRTAAEKLAGIVSEKLYPAFKNVIDFLNRNQEILIGLGTTVGVILVGAFAAWAVATWAEFYAYVALNGAMILANIQFVLIALAIGAIVTAVIYAYNHWGAFREAVDFAKEAVQVFWEKVIKPFAGWLERNFVDILKTVARVMLGIFTGGFSEVAIAIYKHWDDIIVFFTGLPGKIASAATGMWDGVTEAFKSAINYIIRGWNAIEFKIPGFHIGPIGYDGFTLGLPDIDTLHSGGTFRSPNGPGTNGLAMLQDGERVTRGGSSGNGTTEIYKVGERELARFLIRIIDQERRFAGVPA